MALAWTGQEFSWKFQLSRFCRSLSLPQMFFFFCLFVFVLIWLLLGVPAILFRDTPGQSEATSASSIKCGMREDQDNWFVSVNNHPRSQFKPHRTCMLTTHNLCVVSRQKVDLKRIHLCRCLPRRTACKGPEHAAQYMAARRRHSHRALEKKIVCRRMIILMNVATPLVELITQVLLYFQEKPCK